VSFLCRKNVQQAGVFLEMWCIYLSAMAAALSLARTAMLEIASRESAHKRGLHADSGLQAENEATPTKRDR
ncbi:MAG TPA: hypothetical protein VJW55_04115, partial [Candidatus Angelobacter sp.]|nr:hypothetical protein [Candidatus Angelobacter sp.]